MNIRRQYSLPNCTLVLEGLSDAIGTFDTTDGRPLLSILVNAECYFVGSPKKLHGGRSFFEHLVKTVSEYGQECLSSIHHPQEAPKDGDHLHFEKIEGTDFHRLIWQPPADLNQEPVEIELTSVQLFDLVEAVDQFFADSRTLPDLTLKLQPISRRYRQPDEPLAQRAISPLAGMAGLVLAALVAMMLPVPPKVAKPPAMIELPPTTTSTPSPTPTPTPRR